MVMDGKVEAGDQKERGARWDFEGSHRRVLAKKRAKEQKQ